MRRSGVRSKAAGGLERGRKPASTSCHTGASGLCTVLAWHSWDRGHTSPAGLPILSKQPAHAGARPWPQPVDPPQDLGEQRSRHRHLGQLEDDVAAVAHDAGADLDQLLAQGRQRPVLDLLAAAPACA